jgi:hypothetical protein
MRVEPDQPVDLSRRIGDHPLSIFFAPYLVVEVALSNGRKFYSHRLPTPKRWLHRRRAAQQTHAARRDA